MMSILTDKGRAFPSKKALKEHVGTAVEFVETSMFGNEHKGAGSYTVVGPDPYKRNWFATVTVDGDGVLRKVS